MSIRFGWFVRDLKGGSWVGVWILDCKVGPGVVGVRGVVEALFLSSVHGRGDPLNHISDASSNQFTYSSHVLIVELGVILQSISQRARFNLHLETKSN